jgi:hypothetical protein
MIEECAEGGEWSATAALIGGRRMVFPRCTGRLPNNTQKQLLEICHFPFPFTSQKEETVKQKKKENAKMCRSKRLWVPLFHEAAQWADCVSLAALDDCLYHFGAVQTDPPPHL